MQMNPSNRREEVCRYTRCYLLVLVGGDCHELGLGEDVGPEGAAGELQHVVGLDDVKSGLVPVHRVQDDLQFGWG